MNDGSIESKGARRSEFRDATSITMVLVVAAILINLGRTTTGLLVTSLPLTWGAGGHALVLAAMVLPIAIVASALGRTR